MSLTFERTPGQMNVTIRDDGRGFDPKQAVAAGSHHFGLDSMRSRMAQVGGSFAIHSRPGSGAEVTLTVPLRPTLEEV